jgi:hypothetical protein
MYQWPNELDPTLFVDLSVGGLSFWKYGMHITLCEYGRSATRGDVTISVYREPELVIGDSVQEILFPPTSLELFTILGLNVVRSWVEVDRATLILEFENSWMLRVRGDLAKYECYLVRIGELDYIV